MANAFISVMDQQFDDRLLEIAQAGPGQYDVDAIEAAQIVLDKRKVPYIPHLNKPTTAYTSLDQSNYSSPKHKSISEFSGREQRSYSKLLVLGLIGPILLMIGVMEDENPAIYIGLIATAISAPLLYWQHKIEKRNKK